LNLYAHDEINSYIILTNDHIFPKNKGGANALSNYQVMRGPVTGQKTTKIRKAGLALPNNCANMRNMTNYSPTRLPERLNRVNGGPELLALVSSVNSALEESRALYTHRYGDHFLGADDFPSLYGVHTLELSANADREIAQHFGFANYEVNAIEDANGKYTIHLLGLDGEYCGVAKNVPAIWFTVEALKLYNGPRFTPWESGKHA